MELLKVLSRHVLAVAGKITKTSEKSLHREGFNPVTS